MQRSDMFALNSIALHVARRCRKISSAVNKCSIGENVIMYRLFDAVVINVWLNKVAAAKRNSHSANNQRHECGRVV